MTEVAPDAPSLLAIGTDGHSSCRTVCYASFRFSPIERKFCSIHFAWHVGFTQMKVKCDRRIQWKSLDDLQTGITLPPFHSNDNLFTAVVTNGRRIVLGHLWCFLLTLCGMHLCHHALILHQRFSWLCVMYRPCPRDLWWDDLSRHRSLLRWDHINWFVGLSRKFEKWEFSPKLP